MPRRLLLVTALAALACLPAAAAQAQAPATGSCPSFRVLHDDQIGALSLPAGTYAIAVATPGTLGCATAADLLRQFLEDFDGKLSGGWTVNAGASSFSRTSPKQSFSVARIGSITSTTGGTPAGQYPATGETCPGTFVVQHADAIGSLAIPAGSYRMNLVSSGRLTCSQALAKLSSFLLDYDGRLPSPWILDAETGTFLRGSANTGFQIEPSVGTPVAGGGNPRLPVDGTPCPGTFSVLHDDMLGALRAPAGPYLVVPRRGSDLTCADTTALLRRFLSAAGDRLPSPWTVATSTGTFTRGSGSGVGFRVKPLPGA